MLFNSVSFALFLPIVFLLYWFAAKDNLRRQNIVLLVSSYFFYACWDWRFMFLLIFSTSLDFFTGLKISEAVNQKNKKSWLWLSVVINLGLLGVFKYYNFFAESFAEAISLLGFKVNLGTLQVILPVGISFYTFHGLSYVFDLYNSRIKPERNFINYSVFVSFFPLLVAGPIERATHLLPQVIKKRVFDYSKAVDGLRQILWGLFKKIVIADNCAEFANLIFNNHSAYSGSTLVLGAIFFSFQIYCDFSGYSDIAIGTARLFGIELLKNFAFPYFSRNIAEFWRRWHISLTSWFIDYLYIPLGGSRGSMLKTIRNVFIIFLVSGLWHGANWTFILWGLLNALYFLPTIIFNSKTTNLNIPSKWKNMSVLKEFMNIFLTFGLTTFAWIFFRSSSVSSAFSYVSGMFSSSLFTWPHFAGPLKAMTTIILTGIFLIVEWIGREEQYAIAKLGFKLNRPFRWAMYFAIIIAIFWLGRNNQKFIYFQF